jgi:hypothetical protein
VWRAASTAPARLSTTARNHDAAVASVPDRTATDGQRDRCGNPIRRPSAPAPATSQAASRTLDPSAAASSHFAGARWRATIRRGAAGPGRVRKPGSRTPSNARPVTSSSNSSNGTSCAPLPWSLRKTRPCAIPSTTTKGMTRRCAMPRKPERAELRNLDPQRAKFEVVASRCLPQLDRVEPVARYARGAPQFIERHMTAMVGEHNWQSREATFPGLAFAYDRR